LRASLRTYAMRIHNAGVVQLPYLNSPYDLHTCYTLTLRTFDARLVNCRYPHKVRTND